MLKQLNKILLITFLFFNLTSCSFALFNKEPDIPIQAENSQMELVQEDVRVDDLDVEPINTQEVKKSVVPDAKKEGKKVLELFLKTMGGVIFCAIVIYLILLFVKKYYKSAFMIDDSNTEEECNLSTPKTKEEALRSFLNRSK